MKEIFIILALMLVLAFTMGWRLRGKYDEHEEENEY